LRLFLLEELTVLEYIIVLDSQLSGGAAGLCLLCTRQAAAVFV